MTFLVGYNGSKAARAALALAIEHAKVFGAKMFVVASAGGRAGETAGDIDRTARWLNEARQRVEAAGAVCDARELVRGLSPGEDIVRFASENAVDVVFVGVEKRSRAQKLILGSTAQYVILKAKCPVMTVKP